MFFLLRLIPGDVCELRMSGEGGFVDNEAIAVCQEELGLNDPKIVQFGEFIYGFMVFDLGQSMWTGKAITHEINLRFQLSIQIAIMATFISVIIAIPLGTISAIRQDTWLDYVVRTFSIAGIAIPSFWLGIMIILGLLISTQAWLGEPWMPPIEYVSPFVDPVGNMVQLIWPAIATGYRYSAVATRMTRSALLEVLREDYIRTARAKGLRDRLVVFRHALRNALLPVVTTTGLSIGGLISGTVITESVFEVPGLGRTIREAASSRDYAMLQSMVIAIGAAVMVINLLTDIAYGWIDPRIRYT